LVSSGSGSGSSFLRPWDPDSEVFIIFFKFLYFLSLIRYSIVSLRDLVVERKNLREVRDQGPFIILILLGSQCSGSGPSDPFLRLTDPDADADPYQNCQ
jgi:hypothetical protein